MDEDPLGTPTGPMGEQGWFIFGRTHVLLGRTRVLAQGRAGWCPDGPHGISKSRLLFAALLVQSHPAVTTVLIPNQRSELGTLWDGDLQSWGVFERGLQA